MSRFRSLVTERDCIRPGGLTLSLDPGAHRIKRPDRMRHEPITVQDHSENRGFLPGGRRSRRFLIKVACPQGNAAERRFRLTGEPLWLHSGCMASFTIRIPDELKARVEDAAVRDKRSVNKEVEYLLDAILTALEMNDEMNALQPGRRDDAMMRLGAYFAAGFPPLGTGGEEGKR
jgi:hypothetical protein